MHNATRRYLMTMAVEMLRALDHCPDGKVKVDNEFLPIAQFENGFVTPNERPPTTVYMEFDGDLWRFQKAKSRWQRA